MGYLTEVVVMNDALDEFQRDPKLFAETIFEGINMANRENKQVSMPFGSYCNYISVEPSRHADHEVLLLHAGNMVIAMGSEQDWQDLCKRNPKLAKEWLGKAKRIVRDAQKVLKGVEHASN